MSGPTHDEPNPHEPGRPGALLVPSVAPKPTSRARRIFKRIALTVLALPFVAVALVGVALLVLDTPAGRAWATEQAVALANDALKGTLSVRECSALALTHVRVEGVTLKSPRGATVLTVSAIDVRPDLSLLLQGTIGLESLEILEPWTTLAEEGDELALLAAIEPETPSTDTGDSAPIDVAIARFALRGGAARITPSRGREPLDDLAVSDLDLDASGSYLGGVAKLDLTSARATVRDAIGELARLRTGTVSADLRDGARSESTLVVDAGESSATIEVAAIFADEAPSAIDTNLRFDVRPSLFARIGQADAGGGLRSAIRGTITSHVTMGDEIDVSATSRLDTDGGAIDLDAELFDVTGLPHGTAHVRTRDLQLAAVTTTDGEVSGDLTADLTTRENARDVTLHLRDLAYDAWRLPEAIAGLVVYDDCVELGSLHVPHLTRGQGHLRAHARYDFDGQLAAEIDASFPSLSGDPNLRQVVPDISGSLRTDVRLRMDTREPDHIDVAGELALDRFVGPGVRARRLHVSGSASGATESPVLAVAIEGSGIHVPQLRISAARVSIDGGPSRYEVHGKAELKPEGLPRDARVTFDLSAVDLTGVRERTLRIDGNVTTRDVWAGPLVLGVSDLDVAMGGDVRLGQARLHGRGIAARVSGSLAASGRFDGALDLDELDLAVVRERLASNAEVDLALAGNATAHVTAEGTMERPTVAATMHLAGLAVDGMALEEGTVEAHLDGEALDVDARLRALRVPQATKALDAELTASTAEERLTARATVRDDLGEVATVSGDLPFDRAALMADPMSLLGAEWDARVEVPRRRLDQLPVQTGAPPIFAWLSVEARGRDGALEVDGSLRAELARAAMSEDMRCEGNAGAVVEISLTTRNDQTEVTLLGDLATQRVMTGHAQAHTPLMDWARQGAPAALPATSFELDLAHVPLAQVPIACRSLAGDLGGHIAATDLFTANPSVTLAIDGRHFRAKGARDVGEVSIDIDGRVDSERAEMQLAARIGDRRALHATASAPLRWGGDVMVPEIGEGGWEMAADFDRAPTSVLLSAVPMAVQPSGCLEGHLRASGSADRFDARGSIAFDRVGFIWTDPAFRVSGLHGEIVLEDRRIVIRDVGFRDRDGTVKVDGHIGLSSDWIPDDVDLQMRLRRFPVRSEGVVMAVVTARVDVDLEVNPTVVKVRSRDVSVVLPADLGRTIQSLDQHQDVLYEDQPGFIEGTAAPRGPALAAVDDPDVTADHDQSTALEAATEAEEASDGTAEVEHPLLPARIEIDMSEPFWIRRNDFAIQLSTELTIVVEEAAFTIEGPVNLRRGTIEIVGKTFDLEPSVVTFDGGRLVDPLVDVTAVHTLSSGDTVTVKVGGRLSAPTLAFSTTASGVETEAEILGLLFGGSSSAGAEDSAVNAIAGVMSGLVSGVLRQQLGGVVPILSIDSTTTGSRVRAGIQADALVPKFLRSIVTGAYFEGFVGTQNGSEGGQSATGGFLLEFYLQHGFALSGTFQEPSSWSADVTWQP